MDEPELIVDEVFSAHAEVVPIEHLPSGEILGILRARGGSSQ